MGHGNAATTSEPKLWVGNLDAAVSEFQLLSLVQNYGEISQFDYVFHRSGPHVGLPRGFAYVTYKRQDDAQLCMDSLNGVKLKAKNVIVKWAKEVALTDESYNPANRLKTLPAFSIPHQQQEPEKSASSSSPSETAVRNRIRAIAAIEAKLKQMERNQDASLNIISSNPYSTSLNQQPASASSTCGARFRSSKAAEAYRKHQRLRFNERARLRSRR